MDRPRPARPSGVAGIARSMAAGEFATHCSSFAAAGHRLCHDFSTGEGELHIELLRAEIIEPMACADPKLTFEALAAVFVIWFEAHPMQQSERATDGSMQAATETWPDD